MRFKVRLMVAGLALVLPSLAMASSTAMQTTVKVTGAAHAAYTYTARSPQKLPQCVLIQGHQNGWVFGLPATSLQVWAVNNSFTDPSAHNVNLASTDHFQVIFEVPNGDNAPKEWSAGPQIQNHATHQGSGTFSIARVPMSGLPHGFKYALTGSINATLPGATTYWEDVNGQLHSNTTAGRVHASASFTCWWAGGSGTPAPGGK